MICEIPCCFFSLTIMCLIFAFSKLFSASLQAIRTGWVHPNINLEDPDEGVVSVLLQPFTPDVMFLHMFSH